MKNKKERIPCVYGNARVQSLGNAQVQSHGNLVAQLPDDVRVRALGEVPGMIVLSKNNSFQEQKKPSFLKRMFAKQRREK